MVSSVKVLYFYAFSVFSDCSCHYWTTPETVCGSCVTLELFIRHCLSQWEQSGLRISTQFKFLCAIERASLRNVTAATPNIIQQTVTMRAAATASAWDQFRRSVSKNGLCLSTHIAAVAFFQSISGKWHHKMRAAQLATGWHAASPKGNKRYPGHVCFTHLYEGSYSFVTVETCFERIYECCKMPTGNVSGQMIKRVQ